MALNYELYGYQEDTVQDCLSYIHGKDQKSGLVIVPTAGGKSVILAALSLRLAGRKILTIVPSEELLLQNYRKFEEAGGVGTFYSASVGKKDISDCTFATIQSLKDKAHEFLAYGIDTIFIDECHFNIPPREGATFMNFIEAFAKKVRVIGFTATPFLLKNGMMGAELKFLTRMKPKFFGTVIKVVPIDLMVTGNFWSKLIYIQHQFDDSGLKLNTTGAEFTNESIAQALKIQGINNNIYKDVKQNLADGETRILVFMDTVENAIKMASLIPNSAAIHAKTPKKERKMIVENFKLGIIHVMFNVGVLTTGFDYPELQRVKIGRPTNSLAWYYQVVGRGTRKHPNKKHCYIEDYCNNVKRFGKVETLEITNLEGFGWGVFNNGVQLTNTPMGVVNKTKAILTGESPTILPERIWFGKFNGQPIDRLPIWYIEFCLEKFNFKASKNMVALKEKFLLMVGKKEEIETQINS